MSATEVITSCKTCPLYAKTAEAKDATGMPYFGICKGSGRFVNEAAAKALPGSDLCPAATVSTDGFETLRSHAASIDPLDLTTVSTTSPTTATLMVADDHLGEPMWGTGPGKTPVSCRDCVFFVRKADAAEVYPGTPVARYDTCAKRGMLVMPGSHRDVAAACSVGEVAEVGHVAPEGISLLPIYVATPTTATDRKDSPMTTAGARADAASAMSEDVFRDLLSPEADEPKVRKVRTRKTPLAEAVDPAKASLDALLAALKTEGMVLDGIDPVEAAEAASEPVVSTDGRKALPKRPKTGMVFDAATFDLSAYEPLPAGAMGVVAVRSTSRASDVVFLPRYADDAFDADLLRDVPAEDDNAYFDHNDVLFRCAVAYATDSVAALWGDAGVGKTEGVEHVARLTRQPFMRISVKWATQVDDLLGRWSLSDGSMVWLEGRFTKAWRNPYVVCVDEPNTGKDEVWQALRAPFDGARTLILDEKDGERIPRHKGTRVYTAMNPSWDARFTGTQPLNDADLDRMQHITVPYPGEAVERQIMEAKCPWLSSEQIDGMLKVARDVRAAVQANTIRISFGPRKMIRWAEAMRYMSPMLAFTQSVSAWMEPGQARLLNDLCDAYFR